MTTLSPVPATLTNQAGPAPAPSTDRGWATLDRVLAFGALVLLVAGSLGHNPTVVLVGLGAAATALMLRWLPLDVAVPAAAFVLLSAAISAGSAAAVWQADLLARPSMLTGTYLVLTSLVAVGSARRPAPCRRTWIARRGWLALAPAAVALTIGIRQSVDVALAKSWAFESTDLVRQMVQLKTEQRAGYLDYQSSAYPRGLHMLEAMVSVPGAPVSDSTRLLDYDLRLTAAAVWLALALVLWVGAATVMRAGHALRCADRVTVAAAFLLGFVLLMTNNFLLAFVYMGSTPSLMSVFVIGALPLGVLAGLPALRHAEGILAATAVQVLLLAHLWQALVIVPFVVFVTCAALGHRDLVHAVRGSSSRRPLYLALLVCVPAGLLAAAPLLSVSAHGGVGLAAIPGSLPQPPWTIAAAAACLTAPLVVRRWKAAWLAVVIATTVGLLAVTAVLMAGASNGFDLTQYYPLKSTWFLLIVVAPLLALGATSGIVRVTRRAMHELGRAGQAAPVLRVTTVATVVALLGAFWLPTVLHAGGATQAAWQAPAPGPQPASNSLLRSSQRYDIAVRYHRDYPHDVVVPYYVGQSAAFDGFTTRLVSELLAFQTDGAAMTRDGQDPCAIIDDLAGHRSAVIISKLPVRRVHLDMARHGCAGRAPVVHVPGGITDVAPLPYS